MEKEPKKGYESLKAAVERTIEWGASFDSPEQLRKQMQWVLDRAQQYADACGVDREVVLEQWETDRTYWWVNYYQDANQPDLSKYGSVVTLEKWMEEGERLYGKDRLDWKFKCPACGHVQTMRKFKEAGKDPRLAYVNCASRHGLGGKKDCKWTTGGFLRIGGRYVIDSKYCPRLIFEFADKEE